MRYSSKDLPENVRRLMPKEEPKPQPAVDLPQSKIALRGLEWQLHAEALKELRDHRGVIVFFSRLGMKSTLVPSGAPDLLFALSGRACAIELKVGRNGLSEEQEWCHIAMRRNGWFVKVCRSIEEVKTFLDSVKNENP